MNKQHIDEIYAWLDSEREYQTGVKVFTQHSKNKTLKDLFPGREARYAGKLTYELQKLVKNSSLIQPLVSPEIQTAKTNISDPEDPDPDPLFVKGLQLFNPDGQPPLIGRLITERSQLYNKRSISFAALKNVAPDNRPETVLIRKKLVDANAGFSSRIEELHSALKDWFDNKVMPDESLIYPIRLTEKQAIESLSLSELERQKANVLKNLSRYNNFLKFQTPTKQKVSDPMKAGPKKIELQKKVAEATAEIKSLNTRIDGLNKSLTASAETITE